MNTLSHSLRIVAGGALISVLAACTTTGGSSSGIADLIVAERGGFVPEGIEYDSRNRRLLVGSMVDGTVYQVLNSGSLVPVIEDEALMASVGIEVDDAGNRLLVANANFGGDVTNAMLGVYDLGSGEQLAMVDLKASIENRPANSSHFANDVAISAAGTAFVTDSPMNIVYRVDRYYQPSVLLDLGPDAGFNLNGIEYHPAGYFLVAALGTGQILKVPVNNPGNWSIVDLDFSAAGADGLVWAPDGSLVVTSNSHSRVLKFRSDDNWRSAQVVGIASFEGQATTAAVVGDDVFVVQPNFTSPEPPVILRARF